MKFKTNSKTKINTKTIFEHQENAVINSIEKKQHRECDLDRTEDVGFDQSSF